MQTFAGIIFNESFACLLVMPWLITGTRLHCRENMHKSWMYAAFINNFLNAVILSERIEFTDKLNLQSIFAGYMFGMFTDFFS